MKKPKILIVDDNDAFLDLFLCLPQTDDFHITPTTSAKHAIKILSSEPMDLIISDIQMPEMTGIQLFATVQDLYPDIPVILITAFGSTEEAIQAVKNGAFHYFENTIDDVYPDHREIYNDYRDEIWGGSFRMNWEMTDNNTFNLVFDGDWGEYDWANYSQKYDTGNWAVYSNDTLTIGNVTFTAGVRYDDNREFDSEISPSGGMVYRFPWADALVRVQVAKGFSAPPGAWINDPWYGNPDLEPEIAVNYQLGGQLRVFKKLKLELNLFRADVDDLIRYDWDTLRFENIDEVRRQGVEGNISAKFDFGLTVSFGASFVDVKDEETHDEIKDIPKTMYNASAVYACKNMTHSLIGKYIDHNSTYPETEDKVFIFDYLLKVNLPFFKKYGKASMFGAAYNLFNSTYLYREVWPKPDRWIEGGVRFEY